jgi:hypothetical protein
MVSKFLARCLLVGLAASKAAAAAETADANADVEAVESESKRPKVVVVVVGDPDTDVFAQLETMVPSEMDTNLQTEFEKATRLSFEELKAKTSDHGVRFVTMLDVSNPARWRLILLDPSTGRAFARTLPGNQADKAALEAVTAIIVSANEALAAGQPVGNETTTQALEQEFEPLPPGPTVELREDERQRRVEGEAPESTSDALSFQLSAAVAGEPGSAPGGYGMHWSVSAVYDLGGAVLHAGPSALFGFSHRVKTELGESEFGQLRVGAQLGVAVPVTRSFLAVVNLEPYAERLEAAHHSELDQVVALDSTPAWAFGTRAGLGAWLFPTSNLGFSASTGVALRSRAPVYADSRDQVVLGTDQTSWFAQGGLVLRWSP